MPTSRPPTSELRSKQLVVACTSRHGAVMLSESEASTGAESTQPVERCATCFRRIGRKRKAVSAVPVDGLAPLARVDSECASWRDIQQARIAAEQRGLFRIAASLQEVETEAATAVVAALHAHPVWPWLSAFGGLGGVQVARLIAIIGDPRRFPGQQCTAGHTQLPDFEVGAPCPVVAFGTAVGCGGTMLPPREGPDNTGTRALQRYLGLDVVDGLSPRKTKGVRAHWNPAGRTAVLMPHGIADAIVLHKGAHTKGVCLLGAQCRTLDLIRVFDAEKARLVATRAVNEFGNVASGGSNGDEAVMRIGIGTRSGFVPEQEAVERTSEFEMLSGRKWTPGPVDPATGLRTLYPFQTNALAHKIAAKRFVGDLLRELKRLEPIIPYGTLDNRLLVQDD